MDSQNQLVQILEKSISATDQAEISATREFLENAICNQFEPIVLELSSILANASYSSVVRMQAGLQLKNILSSNDAEQKIIKHNRWLNLSQETRQIIKNNCFNALSTQDMGHGSASQCVASIACVEIPTNQWVDVIRMLVNNITTSTNPGNLKKSSLETIGYICNEIDPNILTPQSDYILTGIVCGMNEEQTSIKLAATNALLNSLDFTKHNFDNEQERNYIMQVVCETTQCLETTISVVALQCLVKIMSQFYVYMEVYMHRALFSITLEAMKNPNEGLKMQGIEFWSTVAEEEIDLAIEAEECRERGLPITTTSKLYARGALPHICPILLTILEVQEEVDDSDEWNPHKAAGVCLALLAQAAEDSIIEQVLPYVTLNIQNTDWRKREAAVMAFGSILEGPTSASLSPIVTQAMPVLIQLLVDHTSVVRDSTAWAVGRVCEVLPEVALQGEWLSNLLHAMVQALSGDAKVANNVCWALCSLADGAHRAEFRFNEEGDTRNQNYSTYKLSPYFSELVKQLLQTAERQDCNSHSNLRNAAYSALMELMKGAPKDCYACVTQTSYHLLNRLNNMLQVDRGTLTNSDIAQLDEFQGLLCGALCSALRKMERPDALIIADQTMMVLLTIFQNPLGHSNSFSGVQEDALLAVSSLIDAIGFDFNKYLNAFMPILTRCLYNVDDYRICYNAVGLLGDLSSNCASEMIQYLQPIFQQLDAILRNPSAQKSLLPHIITIFGDFALQLGDEFEIFRNQVLETLKQACQAEVDLNDPDMVDYLNELRQSVIETYVGLIQGAKCENPNDNMQRLNFIIPYLTDICLFMEHIGSQNFSAEDLLGSCCGLIGDLACGFGQQSLTLLDKEPISLLLNRGKASKTVKTRKNALYAIQEIKKLKSM